MIFTNYLQLKKQKKNKTKKKQQQTNKNETTVEDLSMHQRIFLDLRNSFAELKKKKKRKKFIRFI